MAIKRLSGVELFGCVAFFLVFLVLGLFALSEQAISIGGAKHGTITYAEGARAVVLGLSFVAGAFGAAAYGLRYTKYKAAYWAILFVSWCGIVVGYLIGRS